MKSTEAKVGTFVVICAVIFCATVYYVGNAQFGSAHVPYKTYLRYAGGLEPGTDVLFGGITVGKVTAVRPATEDPTRIEIDLIVKKDIPVNAKSLAKLGNVSLMSSPALSISTGSNDAPRVPLGGVIASQETLSVDEMQRKVALLADSADATLKSVQADLNDITGDARHLLANLNDITAKQNQQHIANVLANTDAMIARTSPQIEKLTQNANSLVAKMGPTIDHVNSTVENANETITTVREPMQADLVQLQKTLEDTRVLIGNLQAVVNTNSENITYTVENVRMLTDNLNDLSESVKERPWSMIRIRQPKDRRVPKK